MGIYIGNKIVDDSEINFVEKKGMNTVKKYNGNYYDFGTLNKSFLEVAYFLKSKGIKNWMWPLEIKNPKVGLLNIGSEEGKGNELTRDAYEILKTQKDVNFVGNIEPHKMMDGDVDVVVTDGYTGNIVLKTAEGMGKFVVNFLKYEIKSSFLAKIGAVFLMSVFSKMKKKMDSSEYGGAIFLGLNHISVKAHGGSDSKAKKNAIKAAMKFVDADFVEKVKEEIEKIEKSKEKVEQPKGESDEI